MAPSVWALVSSEKSSHLWYFSPLMAMDSHHIYFDYNATTPFASHWKPKLAEWLSLWGNPSSIHYCGRGPKNALRDARRQIAEMIGADPLEIVFTAGGSEANNLALKGVFAAIQNQKLFREQNRKRLVISAVEHPSVTKTAQFLRQQGWHLDIIPVSRSGHIDLETYARVLSEETALVSVMYANNETGSVFPIAKMAKMAHAFGALFHCDGVQALGKALVNVKNWQVDMASFTGHKFYALKGCGVLYVRKGLHLESLILGGGQERHRRAGTENVMAIASLAAMTELREEIPQRVEHMATLRDELERRILAEIPGVRLTGAEVPRLPNTSSVVLDGIDGETLLINLDMKGYAVSTGAACSSGNPEPSPVLLAMGLSREEAQGSLRLSLGWWTTADEVNGFVDVLKATVARLRTFRHGESAVYGL